MGEAVNDIERAGSGLAVLLVLNDEAEASRTRGLLEFDRANSYEVASVIGVESACELLRAGGFDVVVAGLSAGVGSGIASLGVLSRAAPDLAMVVLAAPGQEDMMIEALSRGAQEFVTATDLTAEELGQAIVAAVARRRSEAERSAACPDGSAARGPHLDSLTGLIGRIEFLRSVENAARRSERFGHAIAVLFCDLDHFKAVNDSLGHDQGDVVLRCAAERVRSVLRGSDPVARFGGDEFVVLLDPLDRRERAADVARRVVDAFHQPFLVGGRSFRVTTSVGVSVFRGGLLNAETMVREADTALYRAKEMGRDRFEIFDDQMRAWVDEREATAGALRAALEGGGIGVERVAQFDPLDGEILGFRAVISWRTQGGQVLTGEELWCVAEEAGVDAELGRLVLDRAIGWCCDSPDGSSGREVVVRMPATLLAESDLVDQLTEVTRERALDPRLVVIEVCEGQLLADRAFVARRLSELKTSGFAIALGRYGVGTASVALLDQLRFDYVTLDSELSRRCALSGRWELVSAAAALVRATGSEVIGVDLDARTAIGFDRVEALTIDLIEAEVESPIVLGPEPGREDMRRSIR